MPSRKSRLSAIRRQRLRRPHRPQTEVAEPPRSSSHCYALYRPDDVHGRTYVGYTVDPARRLRQHNQEIKGGARATSGSKNWAFLFVVSVVSDDDETLPHFGPHEGLSLEWHLKRGKGGGGKRHRSRGIARRFQLLREALELAKFNAFLSRMVVAVPDRYLDDAFAALIDMDLRGAALPVAVVSLSEMNE